jgi:hypothetical protein
MNLLLLMYVSCTLKTLRPSCYAKLSVYRGRPIFSLVRIIAWRKSPRLSFAQLGVSDPPIPQCAVACN